MIRSSYKPSVIVLASCLILFSGCGKDKEAGALFKKGRDRVTLGQYVQAVTFLERFPRDYPDHRHGSRAGLFLGKAYLGMGQIDEAEKAFEMTIRQYPFSLKAHKCKYKLAMTAMWRGDPDQAIQQFTQLASEPDGPLCAEAKAMQQYLTSQPKP